MEDQHNGLIIQGIGEEDGPKDGYNTDGKKAIIYLEEGAILAAGHREGFGRVRQYLDHVSDHDGNSLEALTFEAVRAKNPAMSERVPFPDHQ